MTGDRLIRLATAGVVLAVAAFAAVVSYSHIYDLGRTHGQSGTAARLLPLSVDGLILAASLVLLHEARNRRQGPPLAWCLLTLGVGATVAANVAYGLGYGAVGALVSAWPAVGFIGSVELLMGLVRRSRATAEPDSNPVTDMAATAAMIPVNTMASNPDDPPAEPRPLNRPAAKPAKARRAAAIVRANPSVSGAELGRRLGVSERQGRRLLAQVASS